MATYIEERYEIGMTNGRKADLKILLSNKKIFPGYCIFFKLEHRLHY